MVQRERSGSGNWKDHLNGSNPEEKEAEHTHTHTKNPGWQVNCVNITSCCREEKERPTVCLIIKDLMSFHFSEWNDWKQQQSVNNVTQRRVSSGAHQDRTVCSNIYFCLYFTLVFTPFFFIYSNFRLPYACFIFYHNAFKPWESPLNFHFIEMYYTNELPCSFAPRIMFSICLTATCIVSCLWKTPYFLMSRSERTLNILMAHQCKHCAYVQN